MGNVKKNFIFQSAYQLLTMILPFVTAPYISRVLGAENAGIYSYTYTIANYFVLFAMLGINNHGSRLIAQVKDDKKQLNLVFSSLFTLHFIISALAFVVYFLYILFSDSEYRIYAAVQGLYVLAAVLDINWLFFGLEKFKITVTRNTIFKLLTVAMVFICVRDKNDLLIYTLVMAVGNLVSQSVIWAFVRKEVKFVKPDKQMMIQNIKPLCVLFVATMATSLFRTIDKVMLGDMCDMIQVGCYEYADKMIMFPIGIITALGTIMLPRMSNMYKNGNTKDAAKYLSISIEFSMIIASVLTFGMMSIAENFSVIFFGSQYTLTGEIIKYISVTILFISFNNVIRTQYIIPQNKDGIYLCAVVSGAVVNIVLNALLIPRMESNGAVISTIVAYIIVFMIQSIGVYKEIPFKRFLLKTLYPMISGIVMCFGVRFVGRFLPVKIWALLVQIAIGGVIFCLFMSVYVIKSKDSDVAGYIRNTLKALKNKRKA